jgi:hypothetical protein
MSILARSGGSIMPGRGLMNPAFVIKIVPATDDMQEPRSSGRENPNNDFLDNYSVGDTVSAKVDKETVRGKIERVIKNAEGDGIYVIIVTPDGEHHKIEGSQIVDSGEPEQGNQDDYLTSTPGIFNENKFLTFREFNSL